jgi:hypothetical protein
MPARHARKTFGDVSVWPSGAKEIYAAAARLFRARLRRTADFAEGIRASAQRRPPRFEAR